MRRLLLLVLAAAVLVPHPATSVAAPATTVQIRAIVLTSVSDWSRGARRDGLQVTGNADGELRLADGAARVRGDDGAVVGIFESEVFTDTAAIDAVGAVWRAAVPPGTELRVALRTGADATTLGAYRTFGAGDARPEADPQALAAEAPLALAAGTRALQLQVTLRAATQAQNASPIVSDLTMQLISDPAASVRVAGLTAAAPAYGAATLTTPPQVITRDLWSAAAPASGITRANPQGMIIHQVGDDSVTDPVRFLRAMLAYQTTTLGWEDTPYHFVIDADGTTFETRSGGPTSSVPRLASGDAAIHVALLGDGAPRAAQGLALRRLLAWLGQSYGIAPLGRHAITGSTLVVPNITTHNEIVPEAADPSAAVRDGIDALRRAIDETTVRARWYFAEGNTSVYDEQIAIFNPTAASATVRLLLFAPDGPSEQLVSVAAGARYDLNVDELFPEASDLPAIVEANAAVVVERSMDRGGTDFSAAAGIAQAARVWYFAEGSTDGFRTFFTLFNPQNVEVSASILYMKGDGTTAAPAEPVRIPPLGRRVVVVGDGLPGVGFGTRIVASRPIVAERTMTFGAPGSASETGVHTAPGVRELARRWYFAEGTTQAPFAMKILVLNPNAQNADVAVTFLTPDGTSLTRRYAVPPTTRLVVDVNEVVPELGVATTVESDRPVAVERALYWADQAAGTAGPGASAPAFSWNFAAGRTDGNYREYLLLSNPAAAATRVTVRLLPAGAAAVERVITMPGRSRYTLAAHEVAPGFAAMAMTVRATRPVVAERSLFRGAPGDLPNGGGETTLGVPGDQP